MSKYEPLKEYLTAQKDDTVVVDFTFLDELVPGGLPPSARRWVAWWANEDRAHSHCKAWGAPGFMAHPELERGRVTFTRR